MQTVETKAKRGRKPGYKFPPATLSPTATIVRANQLHLVIGLSRATAYRLEASGEFPKRRKLTPGGSVGWLRSELETWLASRQNAGGCLA